MIRILRLFPDVLNINGSLANAECLRLRLEWRGVEVSVTDALSGCEELPECDLICVGSGHGAPSPALLEDAARLAPALRLFVEGGGALLAIGDGLTLLCEGVTSADGGHTACAGVLPASVSFDGARLTGNYAFDCGGDVGSVVAFRNNAGTLTLSENAAPLGVCPDGKAEGLRYKNAFGSWGHGPLLPKNPRLADALLRASGAELSPLDDTLELRAHDYMAARL